MSHYRRINLFGGPGAGKSTAAHFLVWTLKDLGLQVELSREWIKRRAFGTGDPVERCFLQPIAVGEQLQEELEALRTGCIVVTDSPILMQGVYGDHVDRKIAMSLAEELEERWPSLNIFLDRGDKPYRTEGRWQDEEQAKHKDAEIQALLQDSPELSGVQMKSRDWDGLREYVTRMLGVKP